MGSIPPCKVIALPNQKGGTGKTTTVLNLGAALAMPDKGYRSSTPNLTVALGWPNLDDLDVTITTHLRKIVEDEPHPPRDGMLQHPEGFDLMPANIELSSMELGLALPVLLFLVGRARWLTAPCARWQGFRG